MNFCGIVALQGALGLQGSPPGRQRDEARTH
jgi:hypothetical protein